MAPVLLRCAGMSAFRIVAVHALLLGAGALAPLAHAEDHAHGHGDSAGGEPAVGHQSEAGPAPAPLKIEHHAHRGGAAFRIIAGSSRAYPDNTWVFGFGLAGELRVAPHWELVLGTALLLGERSEVLPVELLVKHIVALDARVSLHAAAGPLTAVLFEHDGEGQTRALFGGTANVGFTFWQTESLGILVEAAYQLLAEDRPVHDIEGAVGVSWRR